MTVKLLAEHHLDFLSLKEGCTGSSESTLVKMPHCWKSHVAAHLPKFTEMILGWYSLKVVLIDSVQNYGFHSNRKYQCQKLLAQLVKIKTIFSRDI